ncbi:MAG: tRNA (guanosine(46)-N7)-methyltransferase TrmB [Acidaminococcaceae bacterium]|nr:tRNA (guanosine(46)-N7)-methyltransferase TrmB [Acidaminococcaceae bacterium]
MRLRKKPWITKAMEEVKEEYIFTENIERFKGHWREIFPGKELCLEIGCGKGRFTVGMAELFPEKAFIGIETQQDVAYFPAKAAKEKALSNIRIICANAEKLEDWFEPGEIKELYLNFSDPWPKARHAKRRLTHRNFLALYKKILGSGGHLRFKTDNRALFDFSVEEFKAFGLEIVALSYDLHNSAYANHVQTEYEQKFSALGTPINFCEAVF